MDEEGQIIVSKDGTRIWAQALGTPSKPAVVFIHGFGCTAAAFDKQFSDPEMLSNIYMVRYDVRGHGRSDQPLVAESYESIRHAEDFKVVCEAFKVTKPFLAGWSLGGIIAPDVAAAYGIDTISGSILLGGIPYRSMHSQVVQPDMEELIPGLVSTTLDGFDKTVTEFVRSCFAEGFTIQHKLLWMWVGGVTIQDPLVRIHSLCRIQDETAFVAARKTFPFLSIHGVKDRHMCVDKIEKFMHGNFKNVEFHRLDSAGHAPFYEQPSVVNKIILDFVNRISLQS